MQLTKNDTDGASCHFMKHLENWRCNAVFGYKLVKLYRQKLSYSILSAKIKTSVTFERNIAVEGHHRFILQITKP